MESGMIRDSKCKIMYFVHTSTQCGLICLLDHCIRWVMREENEGVKQRENI